MNGGIYSAAWRRVRARRKHKPLTDELLWHKVYEEYIDGLPKVELGAANLIEAHLRIVPDIAGRIAWKRTPKSFGIWAKEAALVLSHVSLVYELTAFGNLVLFLAARRYDSSLGFAFSTYANFWLNKFLRLYLEELVGIVPRTGHMGEDTPRRSVIDLLEAAMVGRRLYRGKAAGGMAVFDSGMTIPGPNDGDREIEIVGSDGATDPIRLDYLQRQVGRWNFPWIDMGAHFTPRLVLKGHVNTGGRAYDGPAVDETWELEPESEAEPGPNIVPAEICYLKRERPPIRQLGISMTQAERILELERQGYTVRRGPTGLTIYNWRVEDQWRKPTYEEQLNENEVRREDDAAIAA